jgi:glyoxylase-like metal-dependent hydrolase (beta-lactamase superfamily II)
VYLVSHVNSSNVILIDCGGYELVIRALQPQQKISHIFLPHYHYDHIYYMQQWIDAFPDLCVISSPITLMGLSSPKRNLSFYHDDPIAIHNLDNVVAVQDGDQINIFDQLDVCAYETSGHCEGSMTYRIDKYIFTGDALIPNIPTVTKLKTGNKLDVVSSIEKIKSIGDEQSTICPGHCDMIEYFEVDWMRYSNDLANKTKQSEERNSINWSALKLNAG